jgi:hypothetical protein
LLAKIPQGVYLELLLARVAQDVALSADRLRELLRADLAAAPPASDGGNRPAARAASAESRRSAARGSGVGRPGLVTQAIQTLLHFPATSTALAPTVCAKLKDIAETELAGITTLRELLATLRARPGRTTSQILEEWRDRPEHRRLGELQAEQLLLDAAQAGPELAGILERLIGQVAAERQARRYDELLGKVEADRATAAERAEFQALNKRPALPPT